MRSLLFQLANLTKRIQSITQNGYDIQYVIWFPVQQREHKLDVEVIQVCVSVEKNQ